MPKKVLLEDTKVVNQHYIVNEQISKFTNIWILAKHMLAQK